MARDWSEELFKRNISQFLFNNWQVTIRCHSVTHFQERKCVVYFPLQGSGNTTGHPINDWCLVVSTATYKPKEIISSTNIVEIGTFKSTNCSMMSIIVICRSKEYILHALPNGLLITLPNNPRFEINVGTLPGQSRILIYFLKLCFCILKIRFFCRF